MMRDPIAFAIRLITLLTCLVLMAASQAQGDAKNCAKTTWQQCALFVKDDLKAAHNANATFNTMTQWNNKFDETYKAMRATRQPVASQTDLDKIQEGIRKKVDPIEWARDKAIEVIVRRYLPRI